MFDLPPEHAKTVGYSVLAGAGGALGYLYRSTSKGRTIKLARVALAGGMAMFVSIHTGPLFREIGLSEVYVFALNGFVALLGADFAMYLMEKYVLKKLGIDYERQAAQDLIDRGWTPPVGSSMESLVGVTGREQGAESTDKNPS